MGEGRVGLGGGDWGPFQSRDTRAFPYLCLPAQWSSETPPMKDRPLTAGSPPLHAKPPDSPH